MSIKCFSFTYPVILFSLFLLMPIRMYAVTWYTVASGNVQTDPIWSLSGSSPGVLASVLGGFSDSVDIIVQNGIMADVNNISGTTVRDITVQSGGQLMNSGASNRYINVNGDIICDGVIGNGFQYNAISFNVEGDTCLITGSGQFDCSRIRKNSNKSIHSVLVVDMEVRLWYDQFSAVAFYNNSYGARFDVTIMQDGALRLIGSSGSASFSMDGTNGSGLFDNHGVVDIYGRLEIGGTLYLSNNNSDPADSCVYRIRSSGILKVSSIDASPGMISKSRIISEAGGELDLTGSNPFINFSLATNEFNLNDSSLTSYSCDCDQVVNHAVNYGNLKLVGPGFKSFQDTTLIKGSFYITDSSIAIAGYSLVELKGDWVNQVPNGWASGSGHVLMTGDSDQCYQSAAADSIYLLTISKSNGILQIQDTLWVISDLQLNNGVVVTSDSSLLYVNSSGTVTNASQASYVDGPMVKLGNADFIFPVGDSGYFRPVAIESLSTSSVIRAEYIHDDPMNFGFDVNQLDTGLAHVSRCEFWKLSALDPVDSRVGLTWDASSCGVTDIGKLRVARWNGMLWRNEFYSSISGNLSQGELFSIPLVQLISDSTIAFTIGSSDPGQNPLPVSLLDFELMTINGGVIIQWSTTSEYNTSHFVVEKLNETGEYEPLDSIKALGNSNVLNKYEVQDDDPYYGENCYKLIQVDMDGDREHISSDCIDYNMGKGALSCFPNPVYGELKFLKGDNGSDTEWHIIDGIGRIQMRSLNDPAFSIGSSQIINVESLPAGLYKLVIYRSGIVIQDCSFIVL